ncbi:MAG: hypothetical protein K2Q22_04315 [Cytophagales bacterium]|nr:hypothetical protein [Cytophagales bacterium]
MAKTFRNTSVTSENKIPDSKKDILDFLNEEPKSSSKSVNEVTPNTIELMQAKQLISIAPSEDIRQTFVIGATYLEKIKDYVYTKRRGGDFEYTQKNALHDALDLLFKDNVLLERPDNIRQKEEIRSRKIKNGISRI